MTRGRVNHRTASIGVNVTGASLLDTGMIAGSGTGIALAANELPGKIDTIAGYVDHSVSLGEGGYSRHLTITSAGTIAPSAAGAAGVYIPAKAVGGSILNMGSISGGRQDTAGKRSPCVNAGALRAPALSAARQGRGCGSWRADDDRVRDHGLKSPLLK